MKPNVMPSKNSIKDVHDKLLIPASIALLKVESNGIQVDEEKMIELDILYKEKLDELSSTIRSYSEVKDIEKKFGKELNMNSSDQIRELFFNSLGLNSAGLPKTDTGKVSVNKKSRAMLKGTHEIISLFDQHTKYSTLFKMFIKPMPKFVTPDKRVHCNYLLNGTVTGRVSCSRPNLQQVPKNIDSEEIGFDFDNKLNIKHMYVASPGCKLICVDYSQMELKILADYSEDEAMIAAFNQGVDIHLATGSKLANEEITKDSFWRKVAKQINFGIVYGKTADSLAKDLKIPEEDARRFYKKFFSEMPKVEKFISEVHAFVRENEFVTSMFGRRRRLPAIKSSDKWIRFEAQRKAVNMPIQSTASDYTLCSVINLVDLFEKKRMKTKVVATIHDSIIFDTPTSEVEEAISIIKSVMTSPVNDLIYWEALVPYTVDVEIGGSWGAMNKLKS